MQLSADWAAVIDGWALRFLHEMDYLREAQNSVTFKAQMAELEGIMVADHYPALTNLEVLTTQWVEGEKLSESNADDVRELCNTLLNCYLIQLLDTGACEIGSWFRHGAVCVCGLPRAFFLDVLAFLAFWDQFSFPKNFLFEFSGQI